MIVLRLLQNLAFAFCILYIVLNKRPYNALFIIRYQLIVPAAFENDFVHLGTKGYQDGH